MFRQLSSIAVLCLMMAGIAQAADVYKWVDDKGKVHYGQKKPTTDKQAEDISRTLRSGDTSTKTYARNGNENKRPVADDVSDAMGSLNKDLNAANASYQEAYNKLTQAQHEAKSAKTPDEKKAAQEKVSQLDDERLKIEATRMQYLSKLEALSKLKRKLGGKDSDEKLARQEYERIMQ